MNDPTKNNSQRKNKTDNERNKITEEIKKLEELERELEEKERELEEKIKSSSKENLNVKKKVTLSDLLFTKKIKMEVENNENNVNTQDIDIPETQLENIKTFENDSKKTLDKKKISLAEIAIEEKNRERKKGYKNPYYNTGYKNPYKKKEERNIIPIIILSIILLGVISFFILTKEKEPEVDTESENITGIERVEQIELINLNRKGLEEEIEELKQSIDLTEEEIAIIEIIKENSKEQINTEEFFNILETRAPTHFTRPLNENFVLGIGKKNDEIGMFLILRTKDFGSSFSNMLSWENFIIEDLKSIILSENIINSEFQDKILKNKDIRGSSEDNFRESINYLFLNRDFIFITSNKSILELLIQDLFPLIE